LVANLGDVVVEKLKTEIPVQATTPVIIADLLINKNKQNEKANQNIKSKQKDYFKSTPARNEECNWWVHRNHYLSKSSWVPH
jgi:hypothetical protein